MYHMKVSRCVVLTLGALISIAGGCSEPTQPEIVPPPPPAAPPAPVVPVNTPPRVFAGYDVWVPLPANSSVLYGSAYDAESNIESYSWKKVSGPASYSIESPGSLQTKVVNLEEGTYQFELTVTDKGGLTGKATVRIVVYEPRTPGANEFLFKNLRYRCDDCVPDFLEVFTYVIENFHAYVPAGTAFKVFLKVAGSTNWVEVPSAGGEKVGYRINGDRFVIEIDWDYLPNLDRPVDVKITF
jgi:hypothetical protein